MDHFHIALSEDQLRAVSSIGLAHVGDAVYELLVRTWLCAHGKATGKDLHRAAIALVCAPEQARRAQRILPLLTAEEETVFKRRRPRYPQERYHRPVPPGHGAGVPAGLAVPAGRHRPCQRAVRRDDGGGLICP